MQWFILQSVLHKLCNWGSNIQWSPNTDPISKTIINLRFSTKSRYPVLFLFPTFLKIAADIIGLISTYGMYLRIHHWNYGHVSSFLFRLSSYHEYSARTTDKKDVLYRPKRIEFNSINDSPSRFEYSGYSTKGWKGERFWILNYLSV